MHHGGTIGTAVAGASVLAVGQMTQQQAADWIGIALLAWSSVIAGYDRWRAAKRANDKLDLEAGLAELRAKIAAARSELSGLEIARNQIWCEEGR